MFPRSALPKCVAFRSNRNGSYLRYVRGERGAAACKFLEHPSGGEVDVVTSPRARFCVEQPSSRKHDGLVHVRCCYNNKYWVPLQDGAGRWVIGTADEREEDLSKPSCTLFNPVPVTDDKDSNPPDSIRFIHFQLEGSSMSKQKPESYLLMGNEEAGQETYLNACTVLDLPDKVLPKYITFNGDNGKYLSARVIEGHTYLQFASTDIRDPTVLNTTHTNPDGTVRIKSNYFDKFWRRSPNWIWADSDDTSSKNPNTLFRFIKYGHEGQGLMALENLGNKRFCRRITTKGKTDCFYADLEWIDLEAQLRFDEPVLSREISIVDFDVSRAKIYNRGVHTLATARVDNNGSSDSQAPLTLAYKDEQFGIWDSTVTVKHMQGVKAQLNTRVPVIEDDESVTVKPELFSASYIWETFIEKTTQKEVVYEATVPPRTRLIVSYIAKEATCDVPFSYRQRDLLITGEEVTYDFDDGLFRGINYYARKFETREEQIEQLRTRL